MKKLSLIVMAALIAAGGAFAQTLVVSPKAIKVVGTKLAGAGTASMEVYNNGTGTSYYTVSVPAGATSWVTSGTSSGNSTGEIDTVVLTFVTSALEPGFYNTTVTVTQTNAPVTVKTVPVTLQVYSDENQGVAVGPSSMATDPSGVAIGSQAGRAVAVGKDTIQIGAGINRTAGSFQVGEQPVLLIRIDTNTTTDPTDYVPRWYGDQLVGQVGAGTAGWWIATGLTSNDWINMYDTVQSGILLASRHIDTNTTTSVTTYTPRYFGDMLVGQAGAGTGAVWLAIGLTTNDWSQIGGK